MPIYIIGKFVCSAVIFVNFTNDPQNDQDRWTEANARMGCVRNYEKTSPCLKKLIKKAKDDYHAVCGKAIRENKE